LCDEIPQRPSLKKGEMRKTMNQIHGVVRWGKRTRDLSKRVTVVIEYIIYTNEIYVKQKTTNSMTKKY